MAQVLGTNDGLSVGDAALGDGTAGLKWVDSRAPGALVAHRSAVSAADGTTKPAANHAAWLANPGGKSRGRVFVTTTGAPTSCTLRPYLRSGGASGVVGALALQTLGGAPNYDLTFDVAADGDDVLVFVETLSGGSSPAVTVTVSWR